MNDALPTALVTSGGGEIRESWSSISSASTELSSRRRSLPASIRRTASSTIATCTGWRLVQESPENSEILYSLKKLCEFHGLDDKGVNAEFVAPHQVLLLSR